DCEISPRAQPSAAWATLCQSQVPGSTLVVPSALVVIIELYSAPISAASDAPIVLAAARRRLPIRLSLKSSPVMALPIPLRITPSMLLSRSVVTNSGDLPKSSNPKVSRLMDCVAPAVRAPTTILRKVLLENIDWKAPRMSPDTAPLATEVVTVVATPANAAL